MDPPFTPCFPGSITKYLNPKSAYQRQHGPIQGFIAWEGKRPVGRIAAICNYTHNRFHNDRCGFFGFFACIDRSDIANALFSTAKEFLKQQGCREFRGPYNPSINDECGLLVEGHDEPPVIGMPWNPSYYTTLYDNAGLSPCREMQSFHIDLAVPMPERVARIAKRLQTRSKLTLRQLRMNRLSEEIRHMRELYNRTLDRNWGFVPMSHEDFTSAAKEFRAIAIPDMIVFAEAESEPKAFAISLPDFNEILRRTKQTPEFLRTLHILWLLKTHRYKRARLTVLGVAPEFRDRGISAWLFYEQLLRARRHFHDAEIGWVESNNTEIIENIALMGGTPSKRLRIYSNTL